MIKEGRMTEHGQRHIDIAKQAGRWKMNKDWNCCV
jgi:hypothetical protein